MNIEMLLHEFQDILVHEERAKSFYDHYIDQIKDEEVKGQLTLIRDEEIMHMRLANELIKMAT